MINTLLNAIKFEDVEKVSAILGANPELAKATRTQPNKVSHEDDQVPLFVETYGMPNSEKMEAIRRIFIEKGANVNYQYPDGSTIGHSFASIALTTDHPKGYAGLINWIQDGGDVSLKDDGGLNPVQLANMMAMSVPKDNIPGYASTTAILLGLDKRNPFPSRVVENGACDNPDEIAEMTSKNSKLFAQFLKRNPDLKMAYDRDTIAYRAFKEMLFKNNASVNVEIEGSLGGTLGHIFAMEAANRNDQRHYLRLISWIRDGGDVKKLDKMGRIPIQRLDGYAKYPTNKVPFPGLIATFSILQNIKPDKVNDPASKFDSRTPKYNPYPNKLFGGSKADRISTPDTKEGLETGLRQMQQTKIQKTLSEMGLNIKEIAQAKSLTCKMRFHASEDAATVSPAAAKLCSSIAENSQAVKGSGPAKESEYSAKELAEEEDRKLSDSGISGIKALSPKARPEKRQSVIYAQKLEIEKSQLVEDVRSLNQKLSELAKEGKKKETILRNELDQSKVTIEAENKQITELKEALEKKQSQLTKIDESIHKLLNDIKELEDTLICPITQEIMKEPVMSIVSGITYEKSAILDWLKNHNTCPQSNLQMTKEDLKTNYAMIATIEVFKAKLAKAK